MMICQQNRQHLIHSPEIKRENRKKERAGGLSGGSCESMTWYDMSWEKEAVEELIRDQDATRSERREWIADDDD